MTWQVAVVELCVVRVHGFEEAEKTPLGSLLDQVTVPVGE